MTEGTFEANIQELEQIFTAANPQTRTMLRADVEGLIRTIQRERNQPPQFLHRLKDLLSNDAEEDFFDNMPI